MTIISVLYTLIITPLELLFEVIFTVANKLIGNAGLSIIILSLAVNFLVLFRNGQRHHAQSLPFTGA